MTGEAITGSHLIGRSDRSLVSLSTVLSAAGWLGVITPVISHTMVDHIAEGVRGACPHPIDTAVSCGPSKS